MAYLKLLAVAGACLLLIYPAATVGGMRDFRAEQLVQADGDAIAVPGYSVPSLADWNSDGMEDLIVGQGSGTYPAKVRVYLNSGKSGNPAFSSFFYVQSGGADLVCTGSGCMGCFPRVVYWDGDDRKDLLIGESVGYVRLYLNVGSDEAPAFDEGAFVQMGLAGSKVKMYIGSRATPTLVDYDGDGKRDIVSGAIDGKIHIFLNKGTDSEPDFVDKTFARTTTGEVDVGSRSSPEVVDVDCDGLPDLLCGDTYGRIHIARNVGTFESPVFAEFEAVESEGVEIDLPGVARSRPFVCYWTDDVYRDVLAGGGDGLIYLFQGRPLQGDVNADGRVNFLDIAVFGIFWGQADCGECGQVDLSGDGTVRGDDLAAAAANWLATACE